jgi:hypothetical protein
MSRTLTVVHSEVSARGEESFSLYLVDTLPYPTGEGGEADSHFRR